MSRAIHSPYWDKTSITSNLFEVRKRKINCNSFSTIKNGNTDLFSIKKDQEYFSKLSERVSESQRVLESQRVVDSIITSY